MNAQRFPTQLATFLLTAGLALLGILGCNGNAGTSITIRPVDNQMAYARTTFTVEPRAEVTLVFENTATSDAMHHNVVILNSVSEDVIRRVGELANQAGPSKEYIPNDEAILAHTAMAAPGETVELTFTAPSEPGVYRYLCTYPGHYSVMQGTMMVAG